jgi:WD40 repeat protein
MGTSRLAHGTWLTCVRFSADDRWVGAADSDGFIRVWEVASGRLLWEKPKGSGRTLAFSPDGRTLAIGGYYNQTITLWDLKEGEEIHELPQNARDLKFSKDSTMLAAGGRDRTARLWSPQTGELIREFKGHEGELYSVAISPDGRWLASGGGWGGSSKNNEIRLWEIEKGKEIGQLTDSNERLKGLPDAVYSLNFSADGKTLGSAGPYVARIWDVERRKLAHRLENCSYAVAFSPIANSVVACGDFGVYSARDGRQLVKLSGDVGVYGCVAWSHDGNLIASGNQQGFVQLWNAETGKEIVRRWGHEGGIRCVDFSPDGSVAASLSREDATIRIWGTASGKQLLKIPVTWRGSDVWWNEEGSDVLFAPYGREILTWTSDMHVRYWQLDSLEKRSVQLDKSGTRSPSYTSATAMAFSQDGNRAAVMEYNGGSRVLVGIYELDGGGRVASLDPFGGKSSSDAWIGSMAFSSDGRTLAIGALGDSLRDTPAPSVQLWDLKRAEIMRTVRSSVAPPGKVCFSPDGALLATSPTRGSPLQLWRVSDGSEVHHFKLEADAHGRDPAPIAFSPDGRLLAAADINRDIYVWELATKEKIRTFQGHQKAVTSIAFSPDGNTLLSGSEDTTMLLWDVRGAERVVEQLTLKQLDGYWEALADADAEVAAGASKVLLSVPQQAVTLFERRLTAGRVRDVKALPKLIRELSSDDVNTHLQAAVSLKAYGSQASPALFKALAGKPSLTARRRIEDVLESVGAFPIPPDALRRARAIQLLEQIGTEDAAAVLQQLADARPPTPASSDANAALERLRKRSLAPRVKLP